MAKKIRNGDEADSASRILRTVSVPDAFLFFTDPEQYTGVFAVSLTDCCKKLGEVPLKSIEFHFGRDDFEKWFGKILGDRVLANRISRIDRTIRGEELWTTIRGMVQSRFEELSRRKAKRRT